MVNSNLRPPMPSRSTELVVLSGGAINARRVSRTVVILDTRDPRRFIGRNRSSFYATTGADDDEPMVLQ
jgi:hypothetical protein